MRPEGWLMMVVSVSSVLIMTSYCLYRVLTLPADDATDLSSAREIEASEK
jgi:hypothetical protein